jgi:formate hydrogenlyase transcriptional activator
MTKQTIEFNESEHFYHLAQKMMTQLVGARGKDIDVIVNLCLGQMGEYFGVNGVSLGGISKSGELMPALYLWGHLPPKETMLANDIAPGSEMVARFNRDGYLIYNSLEDLDELPQFKEHTLQMGALAGVFWKHRDRGSWIEGMALSSTKPHIWPDDIVEHIGTIGDVLYNAFYRRRAEAEAERLRQFEKVVAITTSEFVHISPERVDTEIVKTLSRICACFGADLGTLLLWRDSEKLTMKVSHEWDAEFVNGPHFLDTILENEYPWLAVKLKESKYLLIDSLDDFPPEAVAERATCERIGIQSILWAPFVSAHGLQGYIALSTVNRPGTWLESAESQLSLVGNVIASAIERERADVELEKAYNEIRNLKDILAAENETLRLEVKDLRSDDKLVGNSPLFRAALFQAKQVANTDSTVLLLGETGTGKGIIARDIHEQSGRSQQPLVVVNCAALPSTLIESELFGHEKGAFTGAINRKIGRFELADGGTIFLDEIGDLPIVLQTKLLRVLQDSEFERLGSVVTKTVDVRVISATNRDLGKLIEQGEFRSDLYYRLGVFPIRLPALRERRDDIPLLTWFFVSELQHRLGKSFSDITARAMDSLISYEWPGNIRELKNIIERSMILSPGPSLELYDNLLGNSEAESTLPQPHKRKDGTMEEVERAHIEKVLETCDWKVRGKGGAAEYLGLKRTTLQSRMKKLGIERPTD